MMAPVPSLLLDDDRPVLRHGVSTRPTRPLPPRPRCRCCGWLSPLPGTRVVRGSESLAARFPPPRPATSPSERPASLPAPRDTSRAPHPPPWPCWPPAAQSARSREGFSETSPPAPPPPCARFPPAAPPAPPPCSPPLIPRPRSPSQAASRPSCSAPLSAASPRDDGLPRPLPSSGRHQTAPLPPSPP